jgi:hypothetical protein
MFEIKTECPTCVVIDQLPTTVSQDRRAVLAHIAGLALGVAIAGGRTPIEASHIVMAKFCPKHAEMIFAASASILGKREAAG